MESENYWKTHLLEALNNTLSSLRESKKVDIFLIIAVAIHETAKGIELNQIIKPCLDGIMKLIIMFGLFFLWKFILAQKHTNEKKQKIINSQQKAIESSKEQQDTKLQIDFDETSSDYRKEISQKNTNPNAKHIYDCFELTWQISIRNKSTVATVKGVKAKLTVVGSDSKKAAQLKFADYNDKPYLRSVDISPTDREFVEVINWFMVHGKEEEELECVTCNIECDRNYNRIPLYLKVGKNGSKIKIEAISDNAPPVSRYFNIGVRNDDNTINKIYMEEAQEVANC